MRTLLGMAALTLCLVPGGIAAADEELAQWPAVAPAVMDIAPKHAGTLMGITNTAGTVPGIIGVFISGLILQGIKKPSECPAFGTKCTPEHPLGATMVSTEGACSAYYRYRGSE